MFQSRASVSPFHIPVSVSQVSKPFSTLPPHVASPRIPEHLSSPHPCACSNLEPSPWSVSPFLLPRISFVHCCCDQEARCASPLRIISHLPTVAAARSSELLMPEIIRLLKQREETGTVLLLAWNILLRGTSLSNLTCRRGTERGGKVGSM